MGCKPGFSPGPGQPGFMSVPGVFPESRVTPDPGFFPGWLCCVLCRFRSRPSHAKSVGLAPVCLATDLALEFHYVTNTAEPAQPPEKNDLFFHRLRGLTVRVGPHGTDRARADASPGRVSALHTGTLGPATGCQGSGHARYALRSVSQPVGLGGRKRADTDFELACDPKKKYRLGPL